MSEALPLNENDINQVQNALSFIWTKMDYRLRSIVITDKIGTISYGRRVDRLTVNLQESTCIVTDQVHVKYFIYTYYNLLCIFNKY